MARTASDHHLSPEGRRCFRTDRGPILNDQDEIVGWRCPGCGRAWATKTETNQPPRGAKE